MWLTLMWLALVCVCVWVDSFVVMTDRIFKAEEHYMDKTNVKRKVVCYELMLFFHMIVDYVLFVAKL